MQQPNVNNVVRDAKKEITYNVVAYRNLSRGERIGAIRGFLSQKKAKKPKRGEQITICTIIGYDE